MLNYKLYGKGILNIKLSVILFTAIILILLCNIYNRIPFQGKLMIINNVILHFNKRGECLLRNTHTHSEYLII